MTQAETFLDLSTASFVDQESIFEKWLYAPARLALRFGRSRLLQRVAAKQGSVLEVQCGSGENLIRLARNNSELDLIGIDTSAANIEAARAKVRRLGLESRITLMAASIDQIDWDRHFNMPEPFDAVMFSYALANARGWSVSLQSALRNLKADGSLFVLDLWDCSGFAGATQRLIRQALKRLGLSHEARLLLALRDLNQTALGELQLDALPGRYGFVAEFK